MGFKIGDQVTFYSIIHDSVLKSWRVSKGKKYQVLDITDNSMLQIETDVGAQTYFDSYLFISSASEPPSKT